MIDLAFYVVYDSFEFVGSIKFGLKWTFLFFPGIPLLMYGLSAVFMISFKETVKTPEGEVYVYFLLKEDKGSLF